MNHNNDFIPYPADWPAYHNGTNTPCDMLNGPCACGAWHHISEWRERFGEGTPERFLAALQAAAVQVAMWPEWKRGVLG